MFVAISPLTIVPMFVTLTTGMNAQQSRALAHKGVFTGFSIAVVLVFAGQALFRFMGITVDDLRIAGGIILLLLSCYDLVFSREQRKTVDVNSDAGVVPLGTPLIVGPAAMTTCIVMADAHGSIAAFLALFTVLSGLVLLLHNAHHLRIVLRPAVARAFGKVMSLFLAAIAVALVRTGIVNLVMSIK